MLKRAVFGGVLGSGIILSGGLSVSALKDYLVVAAERAEASVVEAIPVGVHLDRLRVILDDIDEAADGRRGRLAEAMVRLREARRKFEESRCRRQRIKQELVSYRTATSPSDCGRSSAVDMTADVRVAVARYRTVDRTAQARLAVVAACEATVQTLRDQLSTLRDQRDRLEEKIEELSARQTAATLPTEDPSDSSSDRLAEALELGRLLERRIEIDEVARELRTEVGATDAIDLDGGPSVEEVDGLSEMLLTETLLTEIDQILDREQRTR